MLLPPCHTASHGRNKNGTWDSGQPGTISGHLLYARVCGTHFTNIVWFDPHQDPTLLREGIHSTLKAQMAQHVTSNHEQHQDSPPVLSNSLIAQLSLFAPLHHWMPPHVTTYLGVGRGCVFYFSIRQLEMKGKTLQRRQISRWSWTWTTSEVWTGRAPTCSWDQKSL